MRRLFILLALLVPLAAAGGCDAKATPDECEAACKNVTDLYLGAVDKQAQSDQVLQQMGATGAAMAKEMANLQLEFLKKECVKECNAKATRKQTDCLIKATSSEDINRCN
ncbi:MAG: hypothetical protein IT385_27625 [Deltaproteobacteria bacterium]|nr:hypothetical protein [Deltaproteobacteria bacterium]